MAVHLAPPTNAIWIEIDNYNYAKNETEQAYIKIAI